MKKHRKLITAAVAGAAMLIGALPAFAAAGPRVNVMTTDANPGGSASFEHYTGNTFKLKACDLQKDGFGIRAYASYYKFKAGGVDGSKAEGTDNPVRASKGAGTCGTPAIVTAAAGKTVYVTVCIWKADRNQFCKSTKTTA